MQESIQGILQNSSGFLFYFIFFQDPCTRFFNDFQRFFQGFRDYLQRLLHYCIIFIRNSYIDFFQKFLLGITIKMLMGFLWNYFQRISGISEWITERIPGKKSEGIIWKKSRGIIVGFSGAINEGIPEVISEEISERKESQNEFLEESWK